MSGYDNHNICKACGSLNHIGVVTTDGGYVSECNTQCTCCLYEDYWAYGFYNSEPKEPTDCTILLEDVLKLGWAHIGAT